MVRFRDVEIHVATRAIVRGGKAVHLEPQAFDLLVLLVEQRDRVLSKAELLDGVWGHQFVSEANLTTRIKEIRRAVGDDGIQQHTIKNIRGRGYGFVAELKFEKAPAGPRAATVIGREREMEAILELLATSSLVTLTGPGGVGKSTLAREALERVGPSYADGAHVVELAALDSGEQVLPAVARTVGVVLDNDRPERAIRSIAELDVLLMLDNCEHVIDDAGLFVGELMSVRGARVGVLATSQIRLGLSNEYVFAVQPLGAEEALQLFTARANAVRAAFEIGDVGRDRVSVLLACLDLLPLTIEMAAARLGSMSFDELEHGMSGSMPMPVTHRSPVRRHRSLESLVTWSAELLDESLRRTFTEFAVFAGAVTAADAAAVIGEGRPELLGDLANLAERSLLVADLEGRSTRYRMLVTVRSVAARWLEGSSTAHDVRGRHAAYFAGASQAADRRIRTAGEAEGRLRLDDIANELRTAHRWARSNQPELASDMSCALHLAAYSSFWSEPAEWSRLLLAQYPESGVDSLMGARIVIAGIDANRGELTAARSVASQLSQATDLSVRAAALEVMTDVALYGGRLSEVGEIAKELSRLGHELNDSHAVAIAAVNSALALAYGNDPAGAWAILDELDDIWLSPSDRGWVAYSRGEAFSVTRDPRAKAAYMSAIALAREVGNPFLTSVALVSLATEHVRAGELDDALGTYALCLRDYARQGNFVHAVTTLRNVIEVLAAVGDDHGATVLAAATSGDQMRASYGVESARLSTLLTEVEAQAGEDAFAAWTAEGRLLDLPQAVSRAVELMDQHRT